MTRAVLRLASTVVLLLVCATHIGAQQRVDYEIAFPNPGTHEAVVTATFRSVPAGPLEVRMSRSSPGRYAVHEFAKNVYGVSANDGSGRALAVTRPDPYGWTVAGHDGTVRFRYTVWGDRVDGTFLGIDATHAHLNMPATFAWARGFESAPIRLTVRPQPGWRVATQLEPTAVSMEFTAPNLQYFLDSPTEIGPFVLREWEQPHGDDRPRYRMAVHHLGTEAQVDSFVAMTRAVIDEQHAIWGEPPSYDFGEYTFIVDYLPWASGDGMEHRNSTIVTNRAPIAGHDGRMARIGTISHELFHAWNVERLRPGTLEPFDFERANMSDVLWFAEGFTSYYGPLAIRRAGLYSDSAYAVQLRNAIVTTIESSARAYGSPVEMSQRAAFVDAATSIDPTHHHNIFLSYYTWGAAIAAALDLTLRTRFELTLDDWMRALWRDFGRHQTTGVAPARPYTIADLRVSLGTLTRDTAFANGFFRRYIEGSDVPDYARLLAHAGFLLEVDSVRSWLGASLADDSTGVVVNWTAANGSLFPVGINNGDVIVAVDGEPVASVAELERIVARHQPNDVLGVEVIRRSGRETVAVPLVGRAPLRVVTFEAAGQPLSAELRRFREAWLGSKKR